MNFKHFGMTLGFTSFVAALWSFDPERFTSFMSMASQQTIGRDLFLFSMAAWIHSWKVSGKFTQVTDAINNLGVTFGKVETRIEVVEEKVSKLDSRLGAVEFPNRGMQ